MASAKKEQDTEEVTCQRLTFGNGKWAYILLSRKIFGERSRDRNSGKGENPKLTPEAADGRLYHSCINIPIDTQTHNNGRDSDDEDTSEKAW